MTTFKILQYPNAHLQRKGHKVVQIDDRIRSIIKGMFETHYKTENCAALAATQLDMRNPPHITVIDFSDQKNEPLCLINGEIIKHEGETYEAEGCMSVGGVYEKVKRYTAIIVRAWNEAGESMEFTASGFMAKCIQHELDHLNGMLFIDRLSALKRARIDKKLDRRRRSDENK
jgi:peptide deformylase